MFVTLYQWLLSLPQRWLLPLLYNSSGYILYICLLLFTSGCFLCRSGGCCRYSITAAAILFICLLLFTSGCFSLPMRCRIVITGGCYSLPGGGYYVHVLLLFTNGCFLCRSGGCRCYSITAAAILYMCLLLFTSACFSCRSASCCSLPLHGCYTLPVAVTLYRSRLLCFVIDSWFSVPVHRLIKRKFFFLKSDVFTDLLLPPFRWIIYCNPLLLYSNTFCLCSSLYMYY
jgi:hypothetical protein